MRIAGLLIWFICVSWSHPVHVSIINIELEPSAGRVKLMIKIFADDFQDLILQKYSVQLNITGQEDPGDKIGAVNRYIGESLQLEINGNRAAGLQFSESRLNEEAIWLLYSYEHGGRIRKVRITNTLMLEKFHDQTNLMIVSFDSKQNGYRMDNKTTELTLDIR